MTGEVCFYFRVNGYTCDGKRYSDDSYSNITEENMYFVTCVMYVIN